MSNFKDSNTVYKILLNDKRKIYTGTTQKNKQDQDIAKNIVIRIPVILNESNEETYFSSIYDSDNFAFLRTVIGHNKEDRTFTFSIDSNSTSNINISNIESYNKYLKEVLGPDFPISVSIDSNNKITYTYTAEIDSESHVLPYGETFKNFYSNFNKTGQDITKGKVDRIKNLKELFDDSYTVSSLRGAEGKQRFINDKVIVGTQEGTDVMIDAGYKVIRADDSVKFPRLFYIIRGIPVELKIYETSKYGAIYSAPDVLTINKKEYISAIECVKVIGETDNLTFYTGTNSWLGKSKTPALDWNTDSPSKVSNCNIVSGINPSHLHASLQFTSGNKTTTSNT